MSLKFMKSRGENEMAFERSEPRKLPYGRVEVNNGGRRDGNPPTPSPSPPARGHFRHLHQGECAPIIETDILGPSEAMRSQMDYYAHAKNTGDLLGKLAATEPANLACMHGSAWTGNGSALLSELAETLA